MLAVLGGAGIVGLAFYYIRRWIDKRLTAQEQEEKRVAEARKKRIKLEHKWRHAVGRFDFWANQAIVKGTHNGELEGAMREIEEIEEKMKDLDYEILAENE